ncbi:hypothetical protein CVD28_24930 [Bacillus sp. M6-12]|uniref:hypothetical protein n=1 Tax=Bacillus sp. M6-12 TaxID=2054166 RepID=UPI000C77AA55|nr:hypothetical protein [Bacillus sp. M6-12]PLS15082.1 hypothetical protein CVD28_24930 [Bacillus sp. M6-12]
MVKLGSNVALCCGADSLEVIGTGGLGVEVGKKNQWHNLYVCKKCKKVFYELADFGDVVQLFYSKKGTREYQKELVEQDQRRKENPGYFGVITKMVKVNVFVPVRGGIKIGIKTLKGYRSFWFDFVLEDLDMATYEDFLRWGFENISEWDVSHIKTIYKREVKKLKQEEKVA